ncbi:MAG: MFS transporter [Clostridia bacterium]|nr:MFS transporter [Clostridia bacterium]
MNRNIKIFPIYRVFSYDIFFYYVIAFFYFTDIKGLSVSQYLILEALYPIYGIIFQIPAGIIVKKLGIKNSNILANCLWVLGFIGYIISPNMAFIILSDISFAIGNVIKHITEPALLMQSLKNEKREDEFGKLEGSGVGVYYYIETITSIVAGFLYVLNPYLPFVLGTCTSIIALILATKFKDVKISEDNYSTSIKEYIGELKKGVKNVLKKKRLQALMLYSSIFAGIISIGSTYYKNFFDNLGIDTEKFGLVFALLTIIQGFACQSQYAVERKTKNKTLTFVAIIFTLNFILIGLLGMSNFPTSTIILLVVALLIIQRVFSGIYEISIEKYMLNFTNEKTMTTVLYVNNFFKNIGTSLIIFMGAFVLDNVDMNIGYVLVGVIGLLIMSLILKFMKTRVGLKPEEYVDIDKELIIENEGT